MRRQETPAPAAPRVIAVVGAINEDLHLRVPAQPRPGETVLAAAVQRFPGGKGANQAVAVASGGGPCVLVGTVGDDEAGARITAALGRAGVDVEHVGVAAGQPTGVAVVLVDAGGENSVIVSLGANSDLDGQRARRALAEIPDLGAILAQGELSAECIEAAAGAALGRGARFVLNLAPYRPVSAETLATCDPLVVNEGESRALGAQLGVDAEDHLLRARALARHARSVIITLGGAGAVYADGADTGRLPAPVVAVVDSTGAGDAFVGAVTSALTRGDSLAAACRAGIDSGSKAVQAVGAQSWRRNDARR